jgi:RimJ/RimL family protein N-acetyltransferase
MGMSGSVELVSARLRLRRLRPEDAGAICAYRGLPEVARYQSWESFTVDDAARLIASQREVVPNTPGSWLQLALTLAESGQIVGDCGIHFPDGDERQVELGITLSPAHHGQGLAAEAMGSVLRYAFDSLGKHRAWAVTDAKNEPAARLFRRLGFRQEAHFVEHAWFKGGWCSEYVFALLSREWRARSRPSCA